MDCDDDELEATRNDREATEQVEIISKEIYPKTQRVPVKGETVQITEKLDGSNLVIFKLNGRLYIAQRNTIILVDAIEVHKVLSQKLYKGLYQWIIDHKADLEKELYEGSAICGEWLGMGKLKYSVDEFDKRFYMFAKARITPEFELEKIMYNHDLFIYPFESKVIPSYIGIVPVVADLKVIPSKEHLDSLYEKYTKKVGRSVEGFVVNYRDIVTKYVRMKNGKLQDHFDWEGK